MNKRLNEIYENHSFHDTTFNQSVIKSLGLVTNQIAIKCGDMKESCIIYSSSLISARIIVKLTKNQLYKIKKKNGAISLNFTFKIESEKNNISFYVNSKITHMEEYKQDKPDLYFFVISFINRAPDDLIEILGSHIVKQLNKHKRAEERFVLDNSLRKSTCCANQENILFISGKGKRCILTEISIFSAKIIMVGNPDDFIGNPSVMLIIKCKDMEGVGEMMGNIDRAEVVNEKDSLYSIIINFNQEMIPPSYKLWISEFLELVNIKKIDKS